MSRSKQREVDRASDRHVPTTNTTQRLNAQRSITVKVHTMKIPPHTIVATARDVRDPCPWGEAMARNHQLESERREREGAEFERGEQEREAALRLWGRKANERLRAIREYLAQTSRRSKRLQAIEACMATGDDNAIRTAWEIASAAPKKGAR